MPTLQWSTIGANPYTTEYPTAPYSQLTSTIVDAMGSCSGLTMQTPTGVWGGTHDCWSMYPFEVMDAGDFYNIGGPLIESDLYTLGGTQDSVFLYQSYTPTSGLGFTTWTGLTGTQWRVIVKLNSPTGNLRVTDVEICRATYSGDPKTSVFGQFSTLSIVGATHGLSIDPSSTSGIIDVNVNVTDQASTNTTDLILVRIYGETSDTFSGQWKILTRTEVDFGPLYDGYHLAGCDLIATMDQFPDPNPGIIWYGEGSFNTTSDLSADAIVAKIHNGECDFSTNTGISVIPELPNELLTLQWQLESTDGDEASSIPLTQINQNLYLDFSNTNEHRMRVRFRIKNNTGTSISNFSPQLEVKVNNGNWFHCQHPDRESKGLQSRPYFGEYATDVAGSEIFEFSQASGLSPFHFCANSFVYDIKPNRKSDFVYSHQTSITSSFGNDLKVGTLINTGFDIISNAGAAITSDGLQRLFPTDKSEYPVLSFNQDSTAALTRRYDPLYATGRWWEDFTNHYGGNVDTYLIDLVASKNGTIYDLNTPSGVAYWNGSAWTNARALTPGLNGTAAQPTDVTDELLVIYQYTDIPSGQAAVNIAAITQTTLTLDLAELIGYDEVKLYLHVNDLPYINFRLRIEGTTGINSVYEYYTYDYGTDTLTQVDFHYPVPSISAIDLPDGSELYIKDNANYTNSYGATYANSEGLHAYKACRYSNDSDSHIIQQDIKLRDFPQPGLKLWGAEYNFTGQALGINVDINNNVSSFLYWYAHDVPIYKTWGAHVHTFPYKYLDRTPTTQKMGSGSYAISNSAFLAWGSSENTIGTIGINQEVEVVAELSFDKDEFDKGEQGGLFQLRITDFNEIILPSPIPAEVYIRNDHNVSCTFDSSSSLLADAGDHYYGNVTLSTNSVITATPYNPVIGDSLSFNTGAILTVLGNLVLQGDINFHTITTLSPIPFIPKDTHYGICFLFNNTGLNVNGDVNVIHDIVQFNVNNGLNITGDVNPGGYGVFHGNSNLQVGASVIYTGFESFLANSELKADPSKDITGNASFNDNFSLLNFKTTINFLGQSTFDNNGAFSAAGYKEFNLHLNLNSNSDLTGIGSCDRFFTADLNAESVINANALCEVIASCDLNSSSTIINTPVVDHLGSVIIQSITVLSTQGNVFNLSESELNVTTLIDANSSMELTGKATLTCDSELEADLIKFDSRDIIEFIGNITREVSISLDIN